MFEWFVKKLSKDNTGFTLIELVVVIAILGILAAIAVPKYSQSRKNAAITAHNANVRTLESAATLFVSEGNMDANWPIENETDKTWKNYLQDWPILPAGLEGIKVTTVTRTEKGEDEQEKDVYTLNGDEKYEVIIKNGSITVKPGRTDEE